MTENLIMEKLTEKVDIVFWMADYMRENINSINMTVKEHLSTKMEISNL